MYVKKCECCGKVFFSKSSLKKCCCKECTKEMARRRQTEFGQLCWQCKKAYCRCSWTRYSVPVKDWTADRTVVKDTNGDFMSYKIKKCPEFIRDNI